MSREEPYVDWAILFACASFFGWLLVDGWAHRVDPAITYQFSPVSALPFVAFGAAVLAITAVRNMRDGVPLRDALPRAYVASAIGVVIATTAAVGEAVWHRLLDVETDIAAIVAPTHLAVALGFGLIASGPLRAAIARAPRATTFASLVPGAISLALIFTLLDFFSQWTLRPDRGYAIGPASVFWGRLDALPAIVMTDMQYALGLDDVLVHGTLVVAIVLFLRRALPPMRGLAAIVLMAGGLPVIAMRTLPDHPEIFFATFAALAATAIAAELTLRRVRLAAALVPAAYYIVYFTWTDLSLQTWWSFDVVSGAVTAASIAGWLASFLVFPPSVSESRPA